MATLEQFRDYVSSHPELESQLTGASTPEEVVALAAEAGFDLSLEAFSIPNASVQELSDEMLEQVTGGNIGPGQAHQGNAGSTAGAPDYLKWLVCPL